MNQAKNENEIPVFSIGDTVKVQYRVFEGGKERIQSYQGVVIAKKSASESRTFTVRKISFGVGVEKIFPLYSPKIKGIEVIQRGKVRQAKLYYLRERIGKKAKIKEKRIK
jgi:large subunit ribosomal protein L19